MTKLHKSLSLAGAAGLLLGLSLGVAEARPVRHPAVTHPLGTAAPVVEQDTNPRAATVLMQETHPAPESGSPLGTPGNGSPSNTEGDRD